MKQLSIRCSDETYEKLLEIDQKPTTALQYVVESFGNIRRATLSELKGIFTREEIIGMVSGFNGTIPTWEYLYNKDMFITHVEESEKWEGSISNFEAKLEPLVEKLDKLTAAQIAILQIEIFSFWNNEGEKGYGSPSPDLEKIVTLFR